MSAERKPKPKMIERKCERCKCPMLVRAADVKRGWGRFCSKSCKAAKQEMRTGQFAAYQTRREDDGEPREFTTAHLFSNEEHDCNKE